MKTFSIIVVTKNNASGLKRTLDSISALNYPKREVIVIDGKSSDSTEKVVLNYHSLVCIFVSEPDSGIYNAMNKGISLATGDYLVFMNAGDCFASYDVLSVVSEYDSDLILGASKYGNEYRFPPKLISLYSLLSEGICHQSTYYRTDLLRLHPFDENLKITADLKSVIELYCKEHAIIISTDKLMSICEGNGMSQRNWREIYPEKEIIVRDCVSQNYIDDYIKFSHISHKVINDFSIISHFSSLFPLVKFISKCATVINKHFKHIPL